MQEQGINPQGPVDSKLMIIGEGPSSEDVQAGKPFTDQAGLELTRMLRENGIPRSICYLTTVCKFLATSWDSNTERLVHFKKSDVPQGWVAYRNAYIHPKLMTGIQSLHIEIARVKPNLIVAAGNVSLWVLTGYWGIGKWRGSLLSMQPHNDFTCKVIPIYNPKLVLNNWEWRFITNHDISRVAREYKSPTMPVIKEQFVVRPSFDVVIQYLDHLIETAYERHQLKAPPLHLSCDIETRNNQIACFGLAWSKWQALCIPFLCVERDSYWQIDEELAIIDKLAVLLRHPGVITSGQNWSYDAQYIARYWGFLVNIELDTMIEGHTRFPGLPKGLDFLSSLYRDNHVYWKDEGKEWSPKHTSEDELWVYNCKDCVATWEIAEAMWVLRETHPLKRTKHGTPFEIQQSLLPVVLKMMLRGVRWDAEQAKNLATRLGLAAKERLDFLHKATGQPLNPNSPKQLQTFFYQDMGQKPILAKKKNAKGFRPPTTDADALDTLAKREPIFLPLTKSINEYRELRVALGITQLDIDQDGRIRCSYNIPGTETFRFNSREDAFGFGTNLQNLSSGDEKNERFWMPNMRKLLTPDPEYIMGECDGAQADARVVAWDANDEELMAIFLDPSRDIHNENTVVMFGKFKGKGDPNRQKAKQGVHAVNYGVTAPTLAKTLGITVHEADRFIERWLSAHPAIREWHKRIEMELVSRRYVENAFGYRRFYFDRIEGLLNEGLAWIPQSTVGIMTNLGLRAVDSNPLSHELGIQPLLQTHDSTAYQWPKANTEKVIPFLKETLTIEIPYERPLFIPMDIHYSEKSWGDCK